ncbi:leukocyte-associated immunoglobulin-like receptor 1 isoform X11 [Trachypithecus francoisi]|uniref:leukocyte-associated immunoglobulin-like receptor 1 isoform X9 n=1 Tax=Trachypithecus francoisi TaxID=54180 RepID=UPI00141AB9A3|nr:leukocyte-associated immunoglobulin-like receptor 1 isoform X9 [Trachypithecus francoisi]XP_033085053.1 leukocyte-associated immunoglobulin-like receptor 1 isoform X11 [Trachypithecus francoisi]
MEMTIVLGSSFQGSIRARRWRETWEEVSNGCSADLHQCLRQLHLETSSPVSSEAAEMRIRDRAGGPWTAHPVCLCLLQSSGTRAMSRYPTTLLGLVLCLAQTIHMQEGPLPRPSISAEPGTEIPLGRPVTFVCRSPVGVQTFRLEREGRSEFNDTNDVSQASPSESEARFRIDSVSEGNAGHYRCLYSKSTRWSERSDYLKLVVKGPTQRPLDDSHNERPPRSKDEKQKLQQRPDLAVDVLERTADKATVNGLPEKDRETDNLAPAAGSSQEVTYAQLDHWALTRRTAQAGSPQSTEPMAESCTYAAIARH